MYAAMMLDLEAPSLVRTVSENSVVIRLHPISPTWQQKHGDILHYYVIVVPANLRMAPDDVKTDEVDLLAMQEGYLITILID